MSLYCCICEQIILDICEKFAEDSLANETLIRCADSSVEGMMLICLTIGEDMLLFCMTDSIGEHMMITCLASSTGKDMVLMTLIITADFIGWNMLLICCADSPGEGMMLIKGIGITENLALLGEI